jgi:hypothetical protein
MGRWKKPSDGVLLPIPELRSSGCALLDPAAGSRYCVRGGFREGAEIAPKGPKRARVRTDLASFGRQKVPSPNRGVIPVR